MPLTTFDRSGLAALDEINSPAWQHLFGELDRTQQEFLHVDPHPPGYPWPKDALHFWSRAWEYPYVFHHLRKAQDPDGRILTALDFGSGVTFFPFAAARLGYHVCCVDIDPSCAEGLRNAAYSLAAAPGTVRFQKTDGITLPVPDASIDVLYSVSVLEHLPEPCGFVAEFARVLKPGGRLLITMDIDLDEDAHAGIGPAAYSRLMVCLQRRFEWSCPWTPVHPGRLLTTARGPHPYYSRSELRGLLRSGKALLTRKLWGEKARRPPNLACEGLSMSKRAAPVFDPLLDEPAVLLAHAGGASCECER